ncbi:helix-turn-helix transcriptional regulator [Saccharothrix violaceirubra]|nr:helix-turn-helix transcriptional regulator [Saccharothrix violaceirubra]
MPRRSPGPRERALGAKLRTLREAIEPRMTLGHAAQRAGLSKGVMSKLENGLRFIRSDEVRALCTLYGVPSDVQEQLVKEASDESSAHLEKSLPGVPKESNTLASYEGDACRMTSWQPLLVPGLLQTFRYTEAFMAADGIPADEIEARAVARLRRQEVLKSRVRYTAYIGEFALGVPVGGPAVMAQQLRELIIAGQRPNVTIRVVPSDAVHSGLLGQWLLLEFPHARPVAHVEQLRSALFLAGPDAQPYADAAARLVDVSMNATDSVRIIEQMAETMEGRAGGGTATVEEVD